MGHKDFSVKRNKIIVWNIHTFISTRLHTIPIYCSAYILMQRYWKFQIWPKLLFFSFQFFSFLMILCNLFILINNLYCFLSLFFWLLILLVSMIQIRSSCTFGSGPPRGSLPRPISMWSTQHLWCLLCPWPCQGEALPVPCVFPEVFIVQASAPHTHRIRHLGHLWQFRGVS